MAGIRLVNTLPLFAVYIDEVGRLSLFSISSFSVVQTEQLKLP